MLDVIVYLFENFIQATDAPARHALERHLAEAGFAEDDVHDAIDWLQDLDDIPDGAGLGGRGLRVFAPQEYLAIETEGLNFLLHAEAQGIINDSEREWAIHRLLSLPEGPADEEMVRWVILTILWKKGRTGHYLLLDELLVEGVPELPH